ncbi:hypothetical protein DYB37_009611 [Aphanomyces astaci]|uniref:acylaminoacyl-peptidase n=1 Tax=Aphanomyces astaci TaxID=112090 RepID=A0A3R6XMV6_APHAT|nr:hypothetical protein DYB35_009171 [Aphanomyces astaci]RHZ23467.1 hypothetical protein DYB37_009611 [Aphanomyces astaci]
MTTTSADFAASLLQSIEASQRTFAGGHLVPSLDKENKTVLHATLVWKDRDLVNSTTLVSSTQHVLANNTVVSGLPTSIPSQYVSYSPSNKRSVVITDVVDDKTTLAQFAFYSHHRLVHVHRTPKELHGALYMGVSEGGVCWSEDESVVFYLAEQKEADAKSFWSSANAAADPSKDVSSSIGHQYDHKEDWGEQYVGKRTSRIFTMDVRSGKCAEVAGIPSSLACSEVAVVPRANTIVFTAIDTQAGRRLGLIYCFNRPKALYSLELTPSSTATRLPLHVAANTRSARVSPDGTKVAFLGTADVVTHNTCNMLCILDWTTKEERVVVPIVDTLSDSAFRGLYMLALFRRCWSHDSKFIYVNTEVGTRVVWKAIQVDTGAVHTPVYALGEENTGSETLVDVFETHALVAVSTPQTPVGIQWVQLQRGVQVVSRTPVDIQDASPHVDAWSIESIAPVAATSSRSLSPLAQSATPLLPTVSSDAPYDALVLWPSTTTSVVGHGTTTSTSSTNGFPIVLDLHGGPHSHSPATFRASYAYLCALGFAVVTVNYRGSIGYGRHALESLVGRVGSQDVTDCHHAVSHVLAKYAGRLDASRVHVSGGSHGGFLGAHLIGQFPSFYKSAVLRNPVTNIASLFFTSDIPDWGCAVTGVAAFESIATNSAVVTSSTDRTATVARFWELSPMANDLAAIQAPVLLGLGAKDRRVPPTQGLQFFHSLQHHGRTVRVQWYPDDCHPLDSVKAYADFAVQWGLWLLQHNK